MTFFSGRIILPILALAVICTPLSHACGGKFLVLSKTTSKAQCYVVTEKLSVLMYRDENSEVSRDGISKDFFNQLRNSGQQVRLVRTLDDLRTELAGGQYNAVVSDLPSAAQIAEEVQKTGSLAIVIPVVDKSVPTDVQEAARRYKHLIGASDMTVTKILALFAAFDADKGKPKPGA